MDALAARFWDSNADSDYGDTNEVVFPTHDGNYNVTGLDNTSATAVERYHYSPYRQLAVLDADFSADADGASDVDLPYAYTGRRFDGESGLYQFRYRYYHAQLGRFVKRDLREYFDGLNLYRTYFVPNGTDPSGLASCKLTGYIAGRNITYEDAKAFKIFDTSVSTNPAPVTAELVSDLRCTRSREIIGIYRCPCSCAPLTVDKTYLQKHHVKYTIPAKSGGVQVVGAGVSVPWPAGWDPQVMAWI